VRFCLRDLFDSDLSQPDSLSAMASSLLGRSVKLNRKRRRGTTLELAFRAAADQAASEMAFGA